VFAVGGGAVGCAVASPLADMARVEIMMLPPSVRPGSRPKSSAKRGMADGLALTRPSKPNEVDLNAKSSSPPVVGFLYVTVWRSKKRPVTRSMPKMNWF
jgi:hypothetical protein